MCHALHPGSCSGPTSGNVSLGLSNNYISPRIRVFEDNNQHDLNISWKLTWSCNPEPVAIRFRVALNR